MDNRELAELARFKMELFILMHNAGRDAMANDAFSLAHAAIDQIIENNDRDCWNDADN